MRANLMKTLSIFLLISAFGISACGKKSDLDAPVPSKNPEEETILDRIF